MKIIKLNECDALLSGTEELGYTCSFTCNNYCYYGCSCHPSITQEELTEVLVELEKLNS